MGRDGGNGLCAGPSSKIPFALRWLEAELPYFLGKPKDAMERMYGLLEHCRLELDGCQSGANAQPSGHLPSSALHQHSTLHHPSHLFLVSLATILSE